MVTPAHEYVGRVTSDGHPCLVTDCPCGAPSASCAVHCSCGWSDSSSNQNRTDTGDKVLWLMHLAEEVQRV